MSRTTPYLAAAAACLLAMTAGAGSLPAAEKPLATTVWFGDLDLATDQGNATLYHRLSNAARKVCPQAQGKDLGEYSRSRACQATAIRNAVRTINSPMLARVAVDHGISNN